LAGFLKASCPSEAVGNITKDPVVVARAIVGWAGKPNVGCAIPCWACQPNLQLLLRQWLRVLRSIFGKLFMLTHIPRKRFSQNFLQNPHIIERIVQAIAPKQGEHLVEIGPGLGALTQQLLPIVGAMDAIELDRDLIAPLQEACQTSGQLTIHPADVLHFDFTTLTTEPHSLRIVGNLPYQISTPLLFHLIEQVHLIRDLHFMLQKEVVERMAAPTHTKAYGRLSVMIQYHFAVEPLFIVPNTAFYPRPKVTSQVVRLKPRIRDQVAKDYDRFADIVRQAFNYRRKTLQNSLRDQVDVNTLLQLGIQPKCRAEQLTVEDFIKISSVL